MMLVWFVVIAFSILSLFYLQILFYLFDLRRLPLETGDPISLSRQTK